jgi:hypothetical protein
LFHAGSDPAAFDDTQSDAARPAEADAGASSWESSFATTSSTTSSLDEALRGARPPTSPAYVDREAQEAARLPRRGDVPEAGRGPLSTAPAPSRRWLVVLGVAAVLLVAVAGAAVALGGDDDSSSPAAEGEAGDGPDTGSSTSELPDSGETGDAGDDGTADASVTVEQLEPALLSAAEAGPGFELSVDDGDEMTDDELEASPECRALLDSFEGNAAAGGDEVRVAYERPLDGAAVSHSLALAEGAPAIGELVDALEQCSTLGWTDAASRGSIEMGVVPVDGPGEAAIGIEITITVSTATVETGVEGYGIISFREGVSSSVMVSGGVDPETLQPLPVDRARVQQMATVADEKLAEALA